MLIRVLMMLAALALTACGSWQATTKTSLDAASALVETAHIPVRDHFDRKCGAIARECGLAKVPDCPSLKTCHETWDEAVAWLKRAQAVCLVGLGAILISDKPTALAKAAEAVKLGSELLSHLKALGVQL